MKKKEIRYHLIGWGVYVLYLLIGESFVGTRSKMPLFDFSFTTIKIIEFYICYLWVFPRYLNKEKIPQLMAGIALAAISFIITRYLFEEVLTLFLFHKHNYASGTTFSFYVRDNLYYCTSGILLSLAVYSGFGSLNKEIENKSLREEKIQAELAFLKTQINPHFLYNTLNYIYSLAYPVSNDLAYAVLKLSELMRYMLTESAGNDVELQKEVDYIENYLSIFRLRFEGGFFVDFEISSTIDGKRIPALLLVPFVENALKHGVVNNPEYPVEIKLSINQTDLLFIVNNQINQQQKDHSTGIGLPNIKRRLELLYPNKHSLQVTHTENYYSTVLNLKF